ncbi:MAG: PilZ domain-containing protein [Promethearchaeota archaeon]|jgi:Tfp pilus assembly protein PilZ
MPEKRKAKRKIIKIRVTYSACGLEFPGYIYNLSSIGMFIKTRKPFKPGVPVRISIHVDKDYTICVTGLTVRANNYGFVYSKNGMGIQLLSQSKEYRNFIEELFFETVAV